MDTFCCRCKEDFGVTEKGLRDGFRAKWRMGELRELKDAPKKIRDQFRDWLDHPDGHYLCGNCYFDLTDE